MYWIVNLVDRQVEVYSDPRPEGYAVKHFFTSGEHVAIFVEGNAVGRITVAGLLP